MHPVLPVPPRTSAAPSRWSVGRLLAVACLAVVVVLGACSDDDTADPAPDTEAESGDATEGGDGGSDGGADDATTTSAPLEDDEFAAEIQQFTDAVADAGADVCALNDIITGSPPPEAATSEQSEQLVGLYSQLLRAVADAVPEDPEVADPFRSAAEQLEAEAEDAGYPPDLLSSSSTLPAALASEEFLLANEGFGRIVEERCPGAGGGGDPAAPTPPPG